MVVLVDHDQNFALDAHFSHRRDVVSQDGHHHGVVVLVDHDQNFALDAHFGNRRGAGGLDGHRHGVVVLHPPVEVDGYLEQMVALGDPFARRCRSGDAQVVNLVYRRVAWHNDAIGKND
ncbi:MAG: hypothetical protein HQ486_04165 [Acidimicrobiaceae bacterium]|nr:hypothetical protein [Acidimicrobiaceae bacterium]